MSKLLFLRSYRDALYGFRLGFRERGLFRCLMVLQAGAGAPKLQGSSRSVHTKKKVMSFIGFRVLGFRA